MRLSGESGGWRGGKVEINLSNKNVYEVRWSKKEKGEVSPHPLKQTSPVAQPANIFDV